MIPGAEISFTVDYWIIWQPLYTGKIKNCDV
jgi:hypothetical protein